MLVAALASVAGVYAVKPIATASLLLAWTFEAARRRWFAPHQNAA
jgi:hypothetical protein